MKLFGSIKELVSAVFRKNSFEVTLRPNNSTTYTAARTLDLPQGDSDHVIVSRTSTDTLTNKSIDADTNTITNIENADIKAAAAIARTKLASGSASHVLVNDGSGVFSSEAQLDRTRGGTGVSSTATFPTSGVVVTEAGTQTLTNKTLTTPVIATVVNTGTLTLPTSTDTLVGRATTDTLTNKTLTSPVASDPTVRGTLLLQNTSGSQPILQLSEDPDNGTNKVSVQAPANLTADYTLTLPADDGGSGQVLSTDGSGVLSWVASSALTANVRSSEGAGTTTLTSSDNRYQIFNLSAARTCQLPTTGVNAGDVWEIENQTALSSSDFSLTITASGGSALTVANGANVDATIRNGYVRLVALQATPTTPAHWRVAEVNETHQHSTAFTFTGGATVSAKTLRIVRQDRQVTVHFPDSINSTAAGNSGTISSDTAIPSRFTSVVTHQNWCFAREAGINVHGYIRISNGGTTFQLGKGPNEAFALSVGNSNGLENGCAITYTTA